MEEVPFYVPLTFILTTALTFLLFVRATHLPRFARIGLLLWLGFQGCLAYAGFYLEVSSHPFRFLLAAPPALLLILGIFVSKHGKQWIETLDVKKLTLLHTVRIPVEIVLYWFFLYKMIPGLMTFSGRNFDILAGITAPVVYYLVFIRETMGRKALLLWNIICLLLLLNIIAHAILSTPIPVQQFAFDQPNRAILYFPLVWLPTFVVPIVLFSHFVAIYKLAFLKTTK